jgi:transposase
MPPDLREWLDEDHLARFVIEAIEELDLEDVYASYRADGHGRAAHDPKMMLALLTYAYTVGERSSRGIERRCREDVAFRVICANQVPDHATIARFRVRHGKALSDIFSQVLGLCAKAGLVNVGVIALDGSKFAQLPPRLQRPGRHHRESDHRRRRDHHRRCRLPAARADDRSGRARARSAGIKTRTRN